MNADLNSGKGRCQSTARLLIKPVQAVIELGASQDVLIKALNAVHHANRHGAADDFIAVALPGMKMGRHCMQPGHEIELVGSETSLLAFLGLEGPRSLTRRGMLMNAEIENAFSDAGMPGTAYVRDRSCEKHTPSWIRRSQARAARRGKPVGKPAQVRGNDLGTLALHYGRIVLHVRQIVGKVTEEPIMVSTYGFSAQGAPAMLPVMPMQSPAGLAAERLAK